MDAIFIHRVVDMILLGIPVNVERFLSRSRKIGLLGCFCGDSRHWRRDIPPLGGLYLEIVNAHSLRLGNIR